MQSKAEHWIWSEAQIASIYFHFNQSWFSLEQGCTPPQIKCLDFDTLILYCAHAMLNDLGSTLLQGELTQS